MKLIVRNHAPDFSLSDQEGKLHTLADYKGKWILLYFYPKDSTPGCTTEAEQFRDLHAEFAQLKCPIFGISRDSLKSHENFKAKLSLPFELLADTEELACGIFAVIKLKNMYGKQVMGIERSTFLIDAQNMLRQEWRGVKVDGHANAVLDAVKAL